MKDPNEVLHGPFDPDVHAETFTNYLEVVIEPDGTVVYAVPSHVMALARIRAGHDVTLDGLFRELESIPLTESPLDYLVERTGCASLWTRCAVYPRSVTDAQRTAIIDLQRRGLYKGPLP